MRHLRKQAEGKESYTLVQDAEGLSIAGPTEEQIRQMSLG